MSMTRKDYIKIAKVVSKCRWAYVDEDVYFDFIYDLCVIFEEDNDRFDPDKFKKATGVI